MSDPTIHDRRAADPIPLSEFKPRWCYEDELDQLCMVIEQASVGIAKTMSLVNGELYNTDSTEVAIPLKIQIIIV